MSTLLVVHHTPSPAMQGMLEAVLRGTRAEGIEGVDVVVRPALSAGAHDVLHADAVALGTPVNIGYLSGALKHFFDTIYYPCLDATRGRPYAAWLHGDNDATGALRALDGITEGLGWRALRPPLVVTGPVRRDDIEACWELGAQAAASLMPG